MIPTQSRVRIQRGVPADLYLQRNLVERSGAWVIAGAGCGTRKR